MAIYVTIGTDGTVTSAVSSQTPPEGALVVVEVRDTVTRHPRKVITGDEGEVTVVPAVKEITPWVASPGEVGIDVRRDLSQIAAMMQSGDRLVDRPVSPLATVVGGQIVVPPCPAGTRIEVYDLLGRELMGVIVAETDDFEEVIAFDTPGTYRVEVHAPAPHIHTATRIAIP